MCCNAYPTPTDGIVKSGVYNGSPRPRRQSLLPHRLLDAEHGDRAVRPGSRAEAAGARARLRPRPLLPRRLPRPPPRRPRRRVQKITLASKALFDFDKAVLKPEGMKAIDTEIIAKLKDVQKLELVLVTGHTDPIGTQAYNQKLSERRADAVRNYLVSKGVAKDKIETLGMGKTQPVPGVVCNQKNMKELIACFAPDRRVEVEVKGEAIKRVSAPRCTKSPASRGAFCLWGRRIRTHAAPAILSPMQTIDLRLDAGWIVPVEPAGALAGHALIVDGGRIAAILPARAADEAFTARTHVTLPGHVLIPGLVNAHTHAAMTLFRGIADDVPLDVWLEAAHLAARSPVRGARVRLRRHAPRGRRDAEGRRHVLQRHVFPSRCHRARERRARHPGDAGHRRARLSHAVRVRSGCLSAIGSRRARRLQARAAARAFRSRRTRRTRSATPAWEKIVMYARQLDLPIQTHVAETMLEVAQSRERHGVTPLARLHRLGATGPGFIGIHAVHLAAADIDLLATHGGHVVHCPISNMKLGSGIAPVAALRARGINVALGTDGAASNNRLDILGEMRMASLLAKVAGSDPAVLPAHEVLEMATLGGARALGLDGAIGSLAPGKQADIVAVDLSASTALPCYDPISHLVHVAGRECVTDVWVGGERVVADRALARADEAELTARARIWQERLK